MLSALGLAAGDERRDRVVSYVRPLGEAGELPPAGEADLRYRGQSFELAVPLGDDLAEALPPRARGALRLRRPRRGRSSSSPSAPPKSYPGRTLELPSGDARACVGPALVELDGSTCWIPPGWEGVRDGAGWAVTRE